MLELSWKVPLQPASAEILHVSSSHPLTCIFNQLELDDHIVLDMNGDVNTAYKRVDRKVKPVPGVFPEEARVIRQIPEDPLKTLPNLDKLNSDFVPNGRLTHERLKELNINPDGFLWPEEEKLFQKVLQLNQHTLVFEEDQREHFAVTISLHI